MSPVTDTLPAVALDLETHCIQPGLLAPPPVCGSIAFAEGGSERVFPVSEFLDTIPDLVRRSELIILANGAYDFGVLAAYGYVSVEDIFQAYEDGRVFDVQIAMALDGIAGGHLFKDPKTFGAIYVNGKRSERYSLEACVSLVLGRGDAKANDFWRARYAMLENVPMADWPEDAKQYPCDDVRNTFDVALGQLGAGPNDRDGEPYRNLHNMKEQARAAWCLHLAAMWGLRTDPEHVAMLQKEAAEKEAAAVARFTGTFLRDDGSEDQSAVKRATAKAYGAIGPCKACGGTGKVLGAPTKTGKRNPVICKAKDDAPGCDGTGLDLDSAPMLPKTEKGGVKTDRDTLMESGDEELDAYSTAFAKDQYLKILEAGTVAPWNPRFNVLVETGRTSSDAQQFPREGKIREGFVARPGKLLCSIDYSAIELCTLAQVQLWMLGSSKMAELINESGDPGSLHTALGAKLMGISFEEMKRLVKAGDPTASAFRQAAKAANFGYPGGMGAATFVLAKRKRSEGTTKSPDGAVEYAGIRLCILMSGAMRCGGEKVTEWKGKEIQPTCLHCIHCAEDLRSQYYAQWEEMPEYFRVIGAQTEGGGEVVQYVSQRIRGGTTFTSAANGYFQALAADGAKHALWNITKESYCDKGSPMYGARSLLFVHDEDLSELDEATAHEAAHRRAEVMVASMREYVPDVTVDAVPALMRRLSKAAKTVYDANGRLIPFDDVKKAAA